MNYRSLETALKAARNSTCLKRQYGAALSKGGQVVAVGWNAAPSGETQCNAVGACYCDTHDLPRDALTRVHGQDFGTCVAVHAEVNAVLNAGERSEGCTLYLVELGGRLPVCPCNPCDRLLRQAGVKGIYTQNAEGGVDYHELSRHSD